MADQPAFTDRDHHKAAPVPATPRPSIYDLRQPALDDPFGELFDRHAPLPPGERAQQELIELYLQNGGADSAAFGDSRFSNESGGALLRTGFDDVTLLELTDTWLEVTDAECIVDEVHGCATRSSPGLPRMRRGTTSSTAHAPMPRP